MLRAAFPEKSSFFTERDCFSMAGLNFPNSPTLFLKS
jgi:hypothetical protein